MPLKTPGSRLCLCVDSRGLTAYGNRQAFIDLGNRMRWLAESNAAEHYECHVTMSLESDESMFEGLRPRNVWVLLQKSLTRYFSLKSKSNTGFELTFMMVEEIDLDDMAKHQKKGILPDDWNKEDL